ncbi:MAG TPA: lysylphosphatidylglycerol synthase transmembrane domain-containing protein [Pyrinomonadaceae bacterium]|nr:lysylphosphatidylglycerol synthase transmembrane domain-containing protein [Pyrinomonadaceae bacterium]
MKSCPVCHRTYADETIAFCLDDGAVLSAPSDNEQATLALSDPVPSPTKESTAPEKKAGSKKLTPIGIIFALLGLLLFAYFVWKSDTGEITRGIKNLGAGFLLVLAISAIRYVVRTLGWTLCFTGEQRLRFRDAFRAYIVGDAMGNLTPLGLVASEPTKAALVRDRVPLVVAISALAVQNLFYSLSVALFILSGIVALLLSFPLTPGLRLMSLISLGVVCAIILIGFVIYRMRWKFISAAFERLRRNRFGRRFLKEKQKESTSAVEDTLYNFYSRNKTRCALIMLLEVCFHLAGVLEVFVTLSFISDVQPTFMAAYVLESVNRIINVVFKFVPLRAGVDEAGSSWVTKVLKFGVATGTTLAIIRKARVICWTALGVAFLVRRGLSTQALAEETQEVMAEELGAPVARVSEPG